MNKKIFLSLIFLLLSCGRENFNTTKLQINFSKNKTEIIENYWIHLYNSETGFYTSHYFPTSSNKTFEIQVTNDSNYILYGFKVNNFDGTLASYVTNKAFFYDLDLSSGGVFKIDVELTSENLLHNEYIAVDSISDEFEHYVPKKIIIRPCNDRNLNSSNCPIYNSKNLGKYQSMLISFYSGTSFNEENKYKLNWKSPCITIDSLGSSFDPMVRIPILKNNDMNTINFYGSMEFFYDKHCLSPSSDGGFFNKGLNLAEENPSISFEYLSSAKVTVIRHRDDKNKSGEFCVDNFNCESNNCETTKKQCR